METKIPKILHYVWVGGGQKSEKMLECMASWGKVCPDYEVIEWNETNFDIENNAWVKLALQEKNWSLASDIMRAWILFEHGGIYVDTDVEILKPLDAVLTNEFFMGYESKHWVNTAIIGSVKGHPILQKIMDRFNNIKLEITSETNLLAVQAYSTVMEMLYKIKPDGKTTIFENGIGLYSKEHFYPQHYLTHKIKITENSLAIHRCSCTWHSKKQHRTFKFFRAVRRMLGNPIFQVFEGIAAKGYRRTIKKEFKS